MRTLALAALAAYGFWRYRMPPVSVSEIVNTTILSILTKRLVEATKSFSPW